MYLRGNKRLALSCVDMLQLIQLRLQKELQISLVSVEKDILPQNDHDEHRYDNTMEKATPILSTISSKHQYQQIRNSFAINNPQYP